MDFINGIRSEGIKVRHTLFAATHLGMPAIGALLFLVYYFLYAATADIIKLKMILEITALVFPLLISVAVGWNLSPEEKASCFQNLLSVPNRYKSILIKLTFLYVSGVFSLFLLSLLFVTGLHLLGMGNAIDVVLLIPAAIGIAICNLILYILHLFLHLRFGLGISLFWGIFESLQCILYSNIEPKGIIPYIPFAWSMTWIKDVLSRQVLGYGTHKIWIMTLTAGGLLLTLTWFAHWEGRKNNE